MTRLRRLVALAVAVLVGLSAVVAIAALGDEDPPSSAVPTTVGGTDPSTSTESPSTTVPSTTRNSTTRNSTTRNSTTRNSTTRNSTTRPFVPLATGKVIPYETGVYVKTASFSVFAFGEDSELVLNELTAALGDADHDTGWRDDDTCEGSATRRVSWGELELVFTKGANGLLPDSLTFQQWHIGGDSALSATLVTPEGVRVGSTVSDLERAYPETKVTRARSSDEAGIYLTKPEGGPFIQGFTKDTDDTSPITSMWAGLACQRILG